MELHSGYVMLCYAWGMSALTSIFNSYTLPGGLSLGGAILTPFCSLFLFARDGMGFGDAVLTGLMSATMAAAVFYYTGIELLKTFGLPRDTTMLEFHKFMTGREI
jgi:hypothetical protein